MDSKITNPSPYPWRQVCGHERNRGYVLVLHQEHSEVIRLAESDVISDANANELFKGLADKFTEYVTEYSVPEHDIIQARAENLAELSGMFGATDRFEGVKVEKISSG